MATPARTLPLPTLAGSVPQLLVKGLAIFLVALVALWLGVNLVKTPDDFYRLFLIGLTNGAIYGLVALGYSLVYGILELINFAHGDVFMLGGMLVASDGHLVRADRGRLGSRPVAADRGDARRGRWRSARR